MQNHESNLSKNFSSSTQRKIQQIFRERYKNSLEKNTTTLCTAFANFCKIQFWKDLIPISHGSCQNSMA